MDYSDVFVCLMLVCVATRAAVIDRKELDIRGWIQPFSPLTSLRSQLGQSLAGTKSNPDKIQSAVLRIPSVDHFLTKSAGIKSASATASAAPTASTPPDIVTKADASAATSSDIITKAPASASTAASTSPDIITKATASASTTASTSPDIITKADASAATSSDIITKAPASAATTSSITSPEIITKATSPHSPTVFTKLKTKPSGETTTYSPISAETTDTSGQATETAATYQSTASSEEATGETTRNTNRPTTAPPDFHDDPKHGHQRSTVAAVSIVMLVVGITAGSAVIYLHRFGRPTCAKG